MNKAVIIKLSIDAFGAAFVDDTWWAAISRQEMFKISALADLFFGLMGI